MLNGLLFCFGNFFSLGRRVDRMERSIGSIVTKIDAVLAKLETMEKGRSKRKQTMSKILGTITEDDGGRYLKIYFSDNFLFFVLYLLISKLRSKFSRKKIQKKLV
jgi:hypothetical protein